MISPGFDFQDISRSETAYDPGAPYGEDEDIRVQPTRSATSLPSVYSDTERLNKHKSYVGAASIRSTKSAYETQFQSDSCPSRENFYHGRFNWLAVSILCLAIFSTVFSGIFLGIAIKAPRWGRTIHTGGSMSPSTANVLVQIFAKMIELSFVTVFVTFLGQVLSRRAFSRESRGVTLAEMTMRNWIMQPGSMITHYETVQFAALTFLGMLSLTVAVFAMLYSTAASALVAPSLKFGGWNNRVMSGFVKASFANIVYLQNTCPTPIQKVQWDPDRLPNMVGNTCLQIDHAAQGFHNYQRFMSFWSEIVGRGEGSKEQHLRPPGFGLFKENVTVNATWIEIKNTTDLSNKFGRPINNVTLAMPHTGVVKAAQDERNGVVQPKHLDGIGVYNLRAAVPSPYLNVLCANVAAEEIKGLVYANMTGVKLNTTLDFSELSTWWFTKGVNWTEFAKIDSTPVDDVFGWKKASDRPAFYKFPINFNTVLNRTRFDYFSKDSIYLLGKGSSAVANYTMCRVKAGMTPVCSTEFAATASGGSLVARCEDKNNDMQYNKANSSRAWTTSLDWYDVGSEALDALSLNTGALNGAAANSRMLMQLALQENDLNPALPSPAEALAVLAGCSLLMSAEDTPFVEFWNYTGSVILSEPQYQNFNASIRAQEFASGGTQNYQRGFYLILFAVFVLNVFVLLYLLIYKGLVTDFSEPPNLFSLAVNSPPSHLLAGSCGGGPHGKQFKVNWSIETEGQHLFMTDKKHVSGDDDDNGGIEMMTPKTPGTPMTPNTPGGVSVQRSHSKFGRAYAKLSTRKSMF
ncbi:hypothetical protein EJ08DRAFT_584201 [Tothia fuscella]|uniref:Uncharacterized protein n=1 Tax=Tothia fuscella TaxID=1048955 RepID=A0A9P4NVK5_9PEZI|nr:hypothetical protein EJ08DRAFT_584201 [Tothia fuscella]